jgi:hypothetical protein
MSEKNTPAASPNKRKESSGSLYAYQKCEGTMVVKYITLGLLIISFLVLTLIIYLNSNKMNDISIYNKELLHYIEEIEKRNNQSKSRLEEIEKENEQLLEEIELIEEKINQL